MKRTCLLAVLFLLGACCNVAGASLEEKLIVKTARADWRARTGETADEIISKVKAFAHFIPMRWAASKENNEAVASLYWKKHHSDPAEEEASVNFERDTKGRFYVVGGYSEFELGSNAFAISLLQIDANDGVPNTTTTYVLDNKRYDFVKLPNRTLAQALDESNCHLKSPAYVYYVYYVYYVSDFVGDPSQETFYVSLTTDCEVKGDALFTHDGYIQFRSRKGSDEWEPVSYLAKRFWLGRALSDVPNSEEQTIIFVRKSASDSADEIIRFIEMRRYKMDMLSEESALTANIKLVQKISAENPRASAHELAAFLRGAGGMAHTLSDEGIEHMSSVF